MSTFVYLCMFELSILQLLFRNKSFLYHALHCVVVFIEIEHLKQQFSFVTLMTRHIYTDEPYQHRFTHK